MRGEVVEEETKAVPVEVPVKVVLPRGVDSAALGEQTAGGFTFVFSKSVQDFRSRTMPGILLNLPGVRIEPDGFSYAEIWAAEGWSLLALAEGAAQISAIGVSSVDGFAGRALLTISSRGDGWALWTGNISPWARERREAIAQALGGLGLHIFALEHLTTRELHDRVSPLLPRIEGARATIEGLRAQRLQEVNGHFEESFARVNEGELQSVLAALDDWILSTDQTVLLLGEFGSGKSTALAVWAERQWQRDSGPRPILVNLAGVSTARDAEGLLLDAAGAHDTPANRATLRLLVRYRFVVPCFDGFDEIATRLGAGDLAGRLSALLEIARGGPGQVLVSCRDNYFSTSADLKSTTEGALVQALGISGGVRRIVLRDLRRPTG